MAQDVTPTGQVYAHQSAQTYPEPQHDLTFTPPPSQLAPLSGPAVAMSPAPAGPLRANPTQQLQPLGPGAPGTGPTYQPAPGVPTMPNDGGTQ
jgi:hypothetical protein